MKKMIQLVVWLLITAYTGGAQNIISFTAGEKAFPISTNSVASPIIIDSNEAALVGIAANLLANDLRAVTDRPTAVQYELPTQGSYILAGTVNSPLIRELAEQKLINTDSLQQQWEGYQIELVSNPDHKGKLMVITGSDRRGVAYGLLEISRQIGVSPWYYWADVPVNKHKDIYYNGKRLADKPAVQYRGIFLNDEAPALSGWAKASFGGFNHRFYEKVFELLLRLKANYLWPAMWGNAFNDDDSLNPVLADRYGIVMGTSHHEPLVRAHDEWRRYGQGKWNYDSNATNLQAFWKKGIKRMGNYENIVTIGMRGDGDEPMTEGTAIGLLERIVKDQRHIIAGVTGKPASQTPQVWALYKEVQDYYDKGMRVPDDVTLLLCDDNWGNIRKLPQRGQAIHKGGFGIYYHFDYVGGPRNYKWINTNQIERTWEQMHLAWEYNARKLWIVNVGDLKPMELPISFFLDYAWDPAKITAATLPRYYTTWAAQQFGASHAGPIGELLASYTRFNSRRKPELLSANTYSLENYDEAGRVTRAYQRLAASADSIGKLLPASFQAAYYELVLHPITASANLQQLYFAVAKNKYYASLKNSLANVYADQAKALFARDQAITNYYNDTLLNGKWKHMMDQTHIGYTYWQQPEQNALPKLETVSEKIAAANNGQPMPARDPFRYFSTKGYLSIEAPHYSKAIGDSMIHWQTIHNLGKTLGAVTPFPVTARPAELKKNSPHLEYHIGNLDTGIVTVHIYCSPTLPFHNKHLHYAVSFDDEIPQIIDLHEGFDDATWNKWVANNIIMTSSKHQVKKSKSHTLKFWMIDAGVVLQKLVIDTGGLKPSYLGPPENLQP